MKGFDQLFSTYKKNLKFFGNVDCKSLMMDRNLLNSYSHFVLAHGCFQSARRLNLANHLTIPANQIINFYNNCNNSIHDDKVTFVDKEKSLGESVTIFGGGNVTLDLIRMFLKSIEELKSTDINPNFLHYKKTMKVREINVILRGPMWPSKMSISCMREISKLKNVSFNFSNCGNFLDDNATENVMNFDRKQQRYFKLLQEMSKKPKSDISVNFLFNTKPISIEIKRNSKKSIKFKSTNKQNDLMNSKFLYSTESQSFLLTDSVILLYFVKENISNFFHQKIIESIGFKNSPLCKEIPFDVENGKYLNQNGFITKKNNTLLYCVGWSKNGPKGTIAETMADSFNVAKIILEDGHFLSSKLFFFVQII